jgi:thiamine biosynthesis lipoprotein
MLKTLSQIVTLLLCACAAGCASRQQDLQRYEYVEIHMGVSVRLTVYAPGEAAAKSACSAAFERVGQLEDVMSDYRPTSELMHLCARAGTGPVPVSSDLFTVLQYAQDVAARSDGAFDVTVGPFVQLWRRARKTGQLPERDELNDAAVRTGWRLIRLDSSRRTVELIRPGMRLDLGGIGKGYAGDAAIATLKQHGIDRALFEAGGDIVVSGPPPGKRGWTIELPDAPQSAQKRTLELANAAVSTSGDTEQFVIIAGQRYSHVVDPHTGIGLTERTMATVIAPRGITSDALSTAITVLGPARGKALAAQYRGVRAFIISLPQDRLSASP